MSRWEANAGSAARPRWASDARHFLVDSGHVILEVSVAHLNISATLIRIFGRDTAPRLPLYADGSRSVLHDSNYDYESYLRRR